MRILVAAGQWIDLSGLRELVGEIGARGHAEVPADEQLLSFAKSPSWVV